MDFLLDLFSQFNTYAKTNPVVAGAVGLWGLGVLTWLVRYVPSSIYYFLKRQLTTTLTFNNSSIGTNLDTFANFMRWFEDNRWSRYSRSLSLNGAWSYRDEAEGTVVGMGNGSHFFLYKSRPFWLSRRQMTEGAMHQVTYEITITALGRNRQLLLDLIEEFRYKPKADSIGIFVWHERAWIRMADIGRRPLKTVVLDPVIKQGLLNEIDRFQGSQSWYEERGLAYKKTFVLCGVGGTGKTSLVKALAGHYGMNICRLSLQSMSDSMLEHAFAAAPKNAMILIEDFDSANATKSRFRRRWDDPVQPTPVVQTSVSALSSDVPTSAPTPVEGVALRGALDLTGGMLSLSGILNALDGVVSLDGRLVFMTTNVLDQIDPALLRKGRVDRIHELKALRHPEVCHYISVMFPEYEQHFNFTFEDILGCDLQSFYLDNSEDVHAFVDAIPKTLDKVSVPKLERYLNIRSIDTPVGSALRDGR